MLLTQQSSSQSQRMILMDKLKKVQRALTVAQIVVSVLITVQTIRESK